MYIPKSSPSVKRKIPVCPAHPLLQRLKIKCFVLFRVLASLPVCQELCRARFRVHFAPRGSVAR